MDYAANLTDRKMRMNYLRTILNNADKVFLYGTDENVEIFGDYLSKYYYEESKNIYRITSLEAIKLENRDVLMPLTTRYEELTWILNKVFCNGDISPLQVIPPSCFFLAAIAEIRGFIEPVDMDACQFPFLATIDMVDRCNLSCKTCPKINEFETSDRMDIGLFRAILDKLQIMGIKQVELYNYTEPFLNPDIINFVREVKSRGLTFGISTNLSLPHIPHLKECVDLLTPGDWFVITISGVKQEIYEINHKNGKISNVIENLAEIGKSEKRGLVTLRLLKFPYNYGELPAAKELASRVGVRLQWFDAANSPFEPVKSKEKNKDVIENGVSLNSYNRSCDKQGFYCQFIHSRNIAINARGNVDLCCNIVTRPYDLGSFLDQDITKIQVKRDMHPLCHKCPYVADSEALKECIPIYTDKIANVLQQGMKAICTERRLHPMNIYNGVTSTEEYLQKCVNRLVE